MNKRELNRERRRQRALERLGTKTPRCVVCGHDDPHALELHHIAGADFGDEKVPVCRNCHRRLSDWQKDHPPRKDDPPSDAERIEHSLHGLADLLELSAEHLRESATKVTDLPRSASKHGEGEP